jgi:hypothetical protein
LLQLWSLAVTLLPAYILYALLATLTTLSYIGPPAQILSSLLYQGIETGIGAEFPLLLLPHVLETARFVFLLPYLVLRILPLGALGFEVLAKACYHPRLDVPELSRFCAMLWFARLWFMDLLGAFVKVVCYLRGEVGVWNWLMGTVEIVWFVGWVLVRLDENGGLVLEVVDGWINSTFDWIFDVAD